MNEIHALGALLQEAMDRNGWSLRALSARADARGFKMSHSNFGRLKDEPVTSMKGETIKMLSQVLQVPESRVAAAALASMNIDLPTVEDQRPLLDLVLSSNELSARDQRILLSVISAMRDDESGTDGQPDPEAPNASKPPRLRAVAPTSDSGAGQKTGLTEAEDKVTPPPIEQLAAHFPFETEHEKFERLHGERGEENQDPGSDF
ncbi:hypothetical protein [Glutamicibacter soli]|uniref:hypothetical protein n=1 Tax=Glutamicibacter soli TaxID=453836 RepID=UPI003FCF7019